MALIPRHEMVNINRLKPAHYNPPNRADPRGLKGLMDAIDTLGGILYPVLVDEDDNIIEGHRRYYAAKHKGLKAVEVRRLPNGVDRDMVYALLGDTSKKHSSNDKLGIWLAEPKAVTATMRAACERAQAEVGLPLLKRLYKLGFSMSAVTAARKVASYCSWPGAEEEILTWMLAHAGMISAAKQAIYEQLPPAHLKKAIQANKKLRFQLA